MAYARTPKSIQGYNIFKAVTALVLIVIMVALLLQGRPDARTVAESPSTPTLIPATATPTVPPPTATAVVDAAHVETPTLVEPQVGKDGGVAFQGRGTPGSIVEVWGNGQRLDQVTVAADGRWSLAMTLTPGEYSVSARAVDAGGKLLAESQHATFAVAAPLGVAPTLARPEIGADGAVALRGTGAPGATVEVWADGKRLDRIIVGSDGKWTYSTALNSGEYSISARAVDASGKVMAESEPAKVVVEPPVVKMPVLTSPQAGETLSGDSVILAGTGEPGTEVEILDQGEVVGTAVVQADGTWTFSYDVEPGARAIAVRVAGAEAIAGEAVEFDVVRDVELPDGIPDFAAMEIDCGIEDAPEGVDLGDTYVVAPCEYMGLIAFRTGVTLDALLAANPDIEDPDLILPGQIINLPPR